MTGRTEQVAASSWDQAARWLKGELAARPGRFGRVMRITFCCTVTVVIAMVFQIPLPAYMAYMVFLISKGDAVGTLTTALGGAIAATLSVVLSLTLFMLDAAEPSLRLPLMAGSTFLAFLLVRTSTLGPIAFLAGFVLVITQTLVDDVPNTEALVRLVMWVWVVAMVPTALTAVVDLALGRQPGRLCRDEAMGVLAMVADALRTSRRMGLEQTQAAALRLVELQQHAQREWRGARTYPGIGRYAIDALMELVVLLPALRRSVPRDVRSRLAEACEASSRTLADPAVSAPQPPVLPENAVARVAMEDRPAVVAVANSLRRLVEALRVPRPEVKARQAPLFATDAWSNPEHAQFALKATLAVMLAYIIYTMLDWPGIRTAVVTCFFVALGSVGETMHKLTLRLAGALIGGLAAGLCIVLVLPVLTDVGQLALLIAAASALSAWVATSSERLSYAGMQIAFAFFLGVLQGYGPATDLTVLRDRIAGIVLGNVLMSIVFSTLWPVSALDHARTAAAQALRVLGDLLRGSGDAAGNARTRFMQQVAEARRLVSVAAFERDLLPRDVRDVTFCEHVMATLNPLGAAVFVAAGQAGGLDEGRTTSALDAEAAAWLDAAAQRVETRRPIPDPPEHIRAVLVETLPPGSAVLNLTAGKARGLPREAIEHASNDDA